MRTRMKPRLQEKRRFRNNPRVTPQLLTNSDVSREVLVTQRDLALDHTGLSLWNWLREPCTPEQLSSKLRRELGWDAERARRRVKSLLRDLQCFGKIIPVREPRRRTVRKSARVRSTAVRASRARVPSMAGYTLVEMIITVAAIAILSGLLLPAVSRARQRGRMTSCAANLMQIGKAYTAGITETNGYLPAAYYSYQMELTKEKSERSMGCNVALRDVPASDPERLLKSEYRPTLLCPCDDNPAEIPDSGSEQGAFGSSYAYNLGLPVLFKNAARVREPSNTVTFYDGDPDALVGSWVHYVGWAQNSARPRHIGMANYLYLDGHVEPHGEFPAMAFEANGQLLEDPFGVWTVSIEGLININPNSTEDLNDLQVFTAAGVILNIGDLVDDVNYTLPGFGEPGLYYEGKASEIAVKSKAPGLFKDELLINGEPYTLPTCDLTRIQSDDMTVRIYNTKRNPQGKAVGKWIMELKADDAILTFE